MVSDYFTPFDEELLSSRDDDLGSGGPMVLPDQAGAHPHLVVTGGKNGVLYIVDRDRMGHYQTDNNSHAVEILRPGGGIYAAPAYWNGHLFVLPSGGYLRDYAMDHGHFPERPAAQWSQKFGNPGATPVVSSDGGRNGIVWLNETRAWNEFQDRPAVLHAYEASDVAHELYNSGENSARDRAGATLRFTVPTVANGRVYVGVKRAVEVYGLLK